MSLLIWKIRNRLLEVGKDNSGVAVVEIILILVVLIGLVIIFKDEASTLVGKIWKAITSGSNTITG